MHFWQFREKNVVNEVTLEVTSLDDSWSDEPIVNVRAWFTERNGNTGRAQRRIAADASSVGAAIVRLANAAKNDRFSEYVRDVTHSLDNQV
jgi:hypothetical protein